MVFPQNAPRVEIRLFGPLEITVDGELISRVRAKKARLLLGYLLLRKGEPVSRAHLAPMFWPDSDEEIARFNLRQLLLSLRKDLGVVGDRLVSRDSQCLSFDAAGCWIDLQEFWAKLASNPRDALGLVRGPLLDGLSADWLISERSLIDAATLDAMEALAVSAPRDERTMWLTRVVESDPLRESAQQKLILHLAESGNLAGATRAYRRFERSLRRELNSAPSADTRRLFKRLLFGASAKTDLEPPQAPNRHNLPHVLTSFVGRETEIPEIRSLLATSRLLTLCGAGGCGKTRLALQVAIDLVDSRPDGVWIVELAALREPDLVARAVGSVFRLAEGPGKPIVQALTEFLRTRRLLLLLDNCEHLAPACRALVSEVLRSCPHIGVLTTSREPLAIGGERVYRVPSLSLPEPTTKPGAAQLAESEAARLFVERTVLVRPGFRITEENALTLATVCRTLDGIPLAIEMAAARMRAMELQELLEKLDVRFQLLTGGDRAAMPRHQTLRSLIDWSYDLLDDAERTMLQRLSVFVGGWGLEEAEHICTGDGLDRSQALDLLTSLVDKSLVTAAPEGSRTRYSLLETVRQYAWECLVETGQSGSLMSRHLEYFVNLAEQAELELTGAKQQEWLTRLDLQHDNLREALGRSLNSERTLAQGMRLAGGVFLFWSMRGHYGEGRSWFHSFLSAIPELECRPLRARALRLSGKLALGQGDDDAARRMLEESLKIETELGRPEGIATCLSEIGNLLGFRGDWLAARSKLEASLAILRQIGGRTQISDRLSDLGAVVSGMGDHSTAKGILEESLAIDREAGNHRGIAISTSRLGDVAMAEGDYALARRLHVEALLMKRELGDLPGIRFSIGALARIFYLLKDFSAEARLVGAAERLREQLQQVNRCRPSDSDYVEWLVELWEKFPDAWAEGSAMNIDEVIEFLTTK